MRLLRFFIVTHLTIFLLMCPPICSAAPDTGITKRYEEIRERYLTLRNTDISFQRADEWSVVAKDFEEFAKRNHAHERAPHALFEAAVLYEELYKGIGGKERIAQSSTLYERLAKEYPGHLLVDDGLLKRGDFLLYELNDKDAARRAYLEIIEAYPETDMVEVAKARVKEIDGELYAKSPRINDSEQDASVSFQDSHERRLIVVIDPGHGGEDFGAVGVGGLLEKDVVLSVALELESLLKEKLGAIVKLTRRGDTFVPLVQRTAMANDVGADIFISLHTNASPNKDISGLETYYLDNSGDQASKKLAERENASTRFEGEGSDLQYMLSDLIQNAKLEDSIALANAVHDGLVSQIKSRFKGKIDLGVKKAPFFVLVGAHMPCILVEMLFIDHPHDGSFLADRTVRQELARGVMTGVKLFLTDKK